MSESTWTFDGLSRSSARSLYECQQLTSGDRSWTYSAEVLKSLQNTSMVPSMSSLLGEIGPTVTADGEMQNINLYFLSIRWYTIQYWLSHQN